MVAFLCNEISFLFCAAAIGGGCPPGPRLICCTKRWRCVEVCLSCSKVKKFEESNDYFFFWIQPLSAPTAISWIHGMDQSHLFTLQITVFFAIRCLGAPTNLIAMSQMKMVATSYSSLVSLSPLNILLPELFCANLDVSLLHFPMQSRETLSFYHFYHHSSPGPLQL